MDATAKIIDYNTLSEKLLESRAGKKVVHCHGVFDLLHIGHIRHFKKAKQLGDILVVTVTPDRYVNKGPGRPVFPERLRAEAIAALDSADFVVINDVPTAVEAIKRVKPDFYVKGSEYRVAENDVTGKILEEETAVKECGGKIEFTEDIVFSSSSLLNQFFPGFPEDVTNYLKEFKTRYSTDEILSYLTGAADLNVLVIGEAIIDEYSFCDAIGKSGKEPVLAAKHIELERYAGGILAIANHVASFCNKVTCFTYFGENKAHEKFAQDHLLDNVELYSVYKKNSPTIVKKRYVEKYTGQKLFELYEMNDDLFSEEERKTIIADLERIVPEYDVVIVADYGHGLLGPRAIDTISQKAKFLAVNTQANAGNHGFNCISKYTKADYACIAHRELELTYRKRAKTPHEHIEQLAGEFNYQNIMVTNGRSGSSTYRMNHGITDVPAFACDIKDRVGAGDSVLAVTSLCMAQNAPTEVVGFIGNVVGAEAVAIMGNKSYIEKIPLMKHITHLLK